MIVCIAEKPSVAKEIAAVIGADQRRDGYFEGNGYCVTWTFGHLCTLKEPNDYSEMWKRWSLSALPVIPEKFGIKLISDKGVGKQFSVISDLLTKAKEVINCGDAGQEGELIQRWVLQKAACKAPVKRLWISSLTTEAIKEGFQKLRESSQFDRLYAAGSSRAIGDWLLGMNATRLYTLKYGDGKQVLSIGRVQTPTLALIVNRHLEIQNFKSATYYELKTKYREVIFNSDKGKLNEKVKAENFVGEIKDHPFTIVSTEKKKAKEAPPRLFDLTALQVECNKRFAMSADDTLKAAQSLYERKYLTYPRVDTTYLPSDLYPKIGGILRSLTTYSSLTQPLLGQTIRKSSKVFDDKKVTDHHAIIPTSVTALNLHGHEHNVYDTVVKRFIAAFYPDCEVANTTVMGDVKGIPFKATGRQILDMGWRVVYQKEEVTEEDNQEETQLLPEFRDGEQGPHEPQIIEKQTHPPKPYTEATLLRAMETAGKQVEDEDMRDAMKDNGIGRPSTRAAIIETLFRRNYIRKEKKNLHPTITGIELIQNINNELLKSVELTGQWEYKLRQIEKGNYEASSFLQEMKVMVTDLVQQVLRESARRITIENKEAEKKPAAKKTGQDDQYSCPICVTGKVIKGNTAYGCSEYKSGCKFRLAFVHFDKELTKTQVSALLSKGKTAVIKGLMVDGTKKNGCLSLSKEGNVVFIEVEVTERKEKTELQLTELECPSCRSGKLIKGNSAYGCSSWKNGCKLRIPFEFMGKTLNEKRIRTLVQSGSAIEVKGLITPDGKKTNGKIMLESGTLVLK